MEKPRADKRANHTPASSRYKELLLGSLGVPIVATDLRGRITYWNSPAEDLFGWSRETAMGRNFFKITHAHILTPTESPASEHAGKRSEEKNRRVIQHRDRIGLSITMMESDLYDEANKLIGYVSIYIGAKESDEVSRLLAAEDDFCKNGTGPDAQNPKPLTGYTLSLCSSCNKINDDLNRWHRIDEYLRSEFNADLTHSLCPDCAEIYHPELFDRKK